MEIIYVSTVTSKRLMNKIIETSKNKPLQSIQKFHRLLCEGFIKNKVKVKAYSSIPMSRKISNKLIWLNKKEKENGVEYRYISFINLKIARQICIFLGTMLNIIKECIKNRRRKVFICDVLNTTISATTLIICKIFHTKCVAIITDLPRDIGKKNSLSRKINEAMQSKFDAYIILTEEMNKIVNTKKRPFVVIEGLIDSKVDMLDKVKYREKVCIYAGGLYEKYGVKMLIEAFINIKDKDVRLHLYGSGELEEYIKKIKDNRIKFFGVVKNDVIIEEEKKATLLINPRFTKEEYTKYSFPSKNMEYMASGTPVLTTKLPGMPKEYYQYVYCLKNENVEEMTRTLTKILNKPNKELNQKGNEAREFVLKEKNNIKQAKKIISVITIMRQEKK